MTVLQVRSWLNGIYAMSCCTRALGAGTPMRVLMRPTANFPPLYAEQSGTVARGPSLAAKGRAILCGYLSEILYKISR